jgi:hypothetical protein
VPNSKANLTGQCQCGNIRYKINGEPLTLYACHCRDCQHQSASAFGLSMRVAMEDFELTSGRLKFWSTTADDGSVKKCSFCPECGTRIYHASDDPGEAISLKAGLLDSISRFSPVAHIWTKRAHRWLDLENRGVLIYPGQPDNFAEIVNAWADKYNQ